MELNKQLGVGSRVQHPAHGSGVVIRSHKAAYEVVFIMHGIKLVGKEYNGWEIVERIEPVETVSFDDAEKSLIKILKTYNGIQEEVELGDKWDDGMLILKPGSEDLQSKEIPIDTFFHKIVMIRDRVRVMEQKINSSKLTDEEKVNLQQYVSRIYGSLTTFNVLFKYKDDHFKSK